MKYRASFPLLVSLIALLGVTTRAFGWIQLYEDEDVETWAALAVDSDSVGHALVVSHNVDLNVSKLDATNGSELWRFVEPPGSFRSAHVAVDAANDVFIAGNGDDNDVVVVKLNGATGTEVWRYLAVGPDPGFDTDVSELRLDPSGDVIVQRPEVLLAKVDSSTGAESWSIAGLGASQIAVDPNGDLLRAGRAGSDLLVEKLDGTTGLVSWTLVDSGGESSAVDLAVDGAGDAFVLAPDYTVIKFDGANGAEAWRHTDALFSFPRKLAVDQVGDAIAIGRNGNGSVAIKFDGATGAEMWREDLAPTEQVSQIALTTDAVYLGGYTEDGDEHPLVVRLDPATGAVQWRNELNGAIPAGLYKGVLDIAKTPAGDVLAAGVLRNRDRFPNSFLAMKLDQDDGSIGGLAGTRLIVRDPGDPEKRSFRMLLKGEIVSAPTPGSPSNPVVSGATVRLWNPSTLEEATFVLPPGASWKGIGKPAGTKGYRYRDKTGLGACKAVTIRPHRKIKVTCTAKNGSIPFTLDEVSQGALAASVSFGLGAPQCGLFGGLITSDEPGTFKAKGATPSASCP